MVLTSAVVAVMVLGLVALNALLAQASFRIDDLTGRVAKLGQAYDQRRLAVAELSSPAHLANAARHLGLRLPQEGIQVLHVGGSDPGRGHPTAPARAYSKKVAGVQP